MRFILVQLLVVTAVLVAIALGVGQLPAISADAQTYSLISVGFFAVVTLFSLLMIQRALRSGRPGNFVNAMVLNFGLRLLGTAVLALVLLLGVQGEPVLVLVPLGSCYLVFTILEAFWLIRLNKRVAKR